MLVGSTENKGCIDPLAARAACHGRRKRKAQLHFARDRDPSPSLKGSRWKRRSEAVHVACACGRLPQNFLARAWRDPRDDITLLQRSSERPWGTRQRRMEPGAG